VKNDAKPKPLRVVLLDADGKPIVGPGCHWQVRDEGKVGFALVGSARVLYWGDKGRTWAPVEDER
jgi:hypothetical protein